MKDDNAFERAVALLHLAVDVLQRASQAPDSPVNTFLSASLRRQARRAAARLRQGQVQPRYMNLHTPEQLADIYERTSRRDEILEQAFEDFQRVTQAVDRMVEENGAAVGLAMDAVMKEARRSAEQHGPRSEAALRYRLLHVLMGMGLDYRSHQRRRRAPARPVPMAGDPSVEARLQASAAEILPSAPSTGEAVIAIPARGRDFGRGRVFMRIGVRERSWIGSFARGHAAASMVLMMPDGKHLFVSAAGAGYIIEARSRTLVEAIGTEVLGVITDEPRTLFVVNHNGMSLEAFGKTGRLWKTNAISAGGFRRMALGDGEISGEARHLSLQQWTPFSVKVATGEVELDARDGMAD